MRKLAVLAFVLLAAGSVSAQPAPSPEELNRQMDMLQRETELLMDAIDVDIGALHAINLAYEELFDFQAYTAIDRAVEHIDEVIDEVRARGTGGTFFALDSGRRLLLDARRGAYFFDMNELRLRLHYRAVHPLQRHNLENLLLLQSLSKRSDELERTIDAYLSETLGEVARASGEGIAE